MNSTVSVTDKYGHFILNFDKVKHSDQGLYRCSVANIIGNDSSDYFVIVEDPVSYTTTIIVTLSGALLLIAALLVGLGFKFYRTWLVMRGLTVAERSEFFGGPEPYDTKFEITDNSITLGEQIGCGEFGVVCKGRCTGLPGKQLAVKSTKPWGDKTKFLALFHEVKLMIRVGPQPNVVEFLGACTNKICEGKLYVLLGYCDLTSNLRRIATQIYQQDEYTVLQQLFQWALQIATGMAYIHTKNIVHGDLATRNVLIDENMITKISDFGLAKQLYNNVAYKRRNPLPLPWRWMAPESLNTLEISPASDVWSYGVTLWEIFSLGKVPYASAAWNSQHEGELRDGYRLTQPHMASTDTYVQIRKCWEYCPEDRPGFDAMIRSFGGLFYDSQYSEPVEATTSG